MLKNFHAETLVDKALLIGLFDSPPKNIPLEMNAKLYQLYAIELKSALSELTALELARSNLFKTRVGIELASDEILSLEIKANRPLFAPHLDALLTRLMAK